MEVSATGRSVCFPGGCSRVLATLGTSSGRSCGATQAEGAPGGRRPRRRDRWCEGAQGWKAERGPPGCRCGEPPKGAGADRRAAAGGEAGWSRAPGGAAPERGAQGVRLASEMDQVVGDAAGADAPAPAPGPSPETEALLPGALQPATAASGSSAAASVSVASLLLPNPAPTSNAAAQAPSKVALDLGRTGYTSNAPLTGLQTKTAARMKMIKSVKKVAVMNKVVQDLGSSTIFEALDKQKKSKNPFVNLYRWLWRFHFHPYSRFHTAWDVFILILVFYSSIMEPYNAAFDQTFVVGDNTQVDADDYHVHMLHEEFRMAESPGMTPWAITIDVAFYVDIIFNFWTGFDRGYEIVYEKKVIAKNYLALWFWVDILATVQWDLIVGALFADVDGGVVRLVRLIKVARLARASRLVHRLTASWTINTGFVEATKFIVYVLICAHILGCFFFMVPTLVDCTGYGTPFIDDDVDLSGDPGKDHQLGHPYENMKSDCMMNSWRDGNFDAWDPNMPIFDTLKAGSDDECAPIMSCVAKYAAECSSIDVSAVDADCMNYAAADGKQVCTYVESGGTAACVAAHPRDAGDDAKPLFCSKAGVRAPITDSGFASRCESTPAAGAGVCITENNKIYHVGDGECETIVGTGDWKPMMGRSYAYVMSMYWAITTMTTIGYGDIGPASQPEIIFVIFAEVIGLSFFAVLLDQINKLNDVLGKQAAEANEVKNEVIGFMKSNGAPMELIHSAIAFLNFKANSNAGSTVEDGDDRFAPLSEALKRRIKIALFKPALINVKMLGHAKDSIAEDKRVKELFEETDEDGGGSLDHSEISGLIKRLGMEMTQEQMEAAFAEMDADGEGAIEMVEFEQWWFLKKFGVPKIEPPPHGFLEEMAFMMSSRTMAKAPDDHIVEAGQYGQRFYILLAGTVELNGSGPVPVGRQMPRKVKHEEREPIFGLSAALRRQYQEQIEESTRDWTVKAVTYCDLLYLDKEDCPAVFRDSWPKGPEELKLVAKYFYVFSDVESDGEAATLGQTEETETLDTNGVRQTEQALTEKIARVQKQLQSSLASLDSKLDKLLAG